MLQLVLGLQLLFCKRLGLELALVLEQGLQRDFGLLLRLGPQLRLRVEQGLCLGLYAQA